jgi:hypothetical protein
MHDQQNLTQTGAIIGTPAYMAPEQAQGGKVDHRCDLFSLGCMLYAMTTGELPFQGNDTISILMSVATTEPAAPLALNPETPRELSNLIVQLLAKNPEDRPKDAAAVAAALHAMETASRNDDATAVLGKIDRPQARKSAPVVRRQKSQRGLLVACGLVLVAAAIVAGGLVFFLPSGNGTIRVEINDDETEVVLTKTGARIKGADKQGDIVVAPGEHALKVKRGDMEFETSKFVLKKGEVVTLKVEFLDGKLQAIADGKVIGEETAVQPRTTAWTPTQEQQTYLNAVANLPLQSRLESVTRKMQELNKSATTNDPVELVLDPKEAPTRCRITQPWVHEIWPLAALSSLTAVDLTSTAVTDFRPLSRLPLTEVQVRLILDNEASETALKSMATLKKLNDQPATDYWAERASIRKEIDRMASVAGNLPVEDQQTWVRGVMRKLQPKVPEDAFKAITVGKTESGRLLFRGYDLHAGVFDFSPVRALPIEEFFLLDGSLVDALPLGKTKLKVCTLLRGNRVRDLSPFAGLPLTELHIAGSPVHDLRPLVGMKLKVLNCEKTGVKDLSPLKGMPLDSLMISGIADLSPLAGMKLKRLAMGNYCPASDLSPLKGMPLESLVFDRSKVTDLSPLAGMKLNHLEFWGSPVADITPLEGMPLTTLDIGRANLDPVLATIPLKELTLVLRLYSESEEKILRGLKLEKINGMAPAEFWKEIEKRRKSDQDRIAEMAKVPLDSASLQKALWICGQYPKVKIEDGAVVEASAGHSNGATDNPFAVFLAFPKLRKLRLESGGDYSALPKLPLLEELECPPQEVQFNLPILRAMPQLKTINHQPAKDALGTARK